MSSGKTKYVNVLRLKLKLGLGFGGLGVRSGVGDFGFRSLELRVAEETCLCQSSQSWNSAVEFRVQGVAPSNYSI